MTGKETGKTWAGLSVQWKRAMDRMFVVFDVRLVALQVVCEGKEREEVGMTRVVYSPCDVWLR